MRPTGRLHLGHFFGALSNWLKLQEEYDCYFFVADWHALTTHYDDASSVAENTLEVATDWLAVGLDPAKATLFIQSSILEHAELHLLLSMITPLGWLERVPTYKEQIENLKDRDLGTYGFLGYPLLQSADIVIYDADFVPVGEDQVPHVELTREIVRRFNAAFGGVNWSKTKPRAVAELAKQLGDSDSASETAREKLDALLRPLSIDHRLSLLANAKVPLQNVLREPLHLLTETPRLPGTDGRRMAKSYGNAIWLSDPPAEIRNKARNMMTDPQRVRRTDPGRPEVCPVFAYHKLFSAVETITRVDKECRTAEIGCVECKQLMADALVKWIEPVQARRKEFEAQPQQVWDILDAGSRKAQKAARRTMRRVREAIFRVEEARKSSATAAGKAATGN
jgi:tryptophanyl-tRNA synthetase